MTCRTLGDDAWSVAAGEAFAEIVRDRLAAQGLTAEVSTEQYAKSSEQDRAVWAVWISTAKDPSFLICEVAEGDASVSLMNDSGAEGYTQPEALAYIAGRVGVQTRKQARAAVRTASPRRSDRPNGEC